MVQIIFLIGGIGCLACAINTMFMIIIAGMNNKKIETIEFNHFGEYWVELILSIIFVACGMILVVNL